MNMWIHERVDSFLDFFTRTPYRIAVLITLVVAVVGETILGALGLILGQNPGLRFWQDAVKPTNFADLTFGFFCGLLLVTIPLAFAASRELDKFKERLRAAKESEETTIRLPFTREEISLEEFIRRYPPKGMIH